MRDRPGARQAPANRQAAAAAEDRKRRAYLKRSGREEPAQAGGEISVGAMVSRGAERCQVPRMPLRRWAVGEAVETIARRKDDEARRLTRGGLNDGGTRRRALPERPRDPRPGIGHAARSARSRTGIRREWQGAMSGPGATVSIVNASRPRGSHADAGDAEPSLRGSVQSIRLAVCRGDGVLGDPGEIRFCRP